MDAHVIKSQILNKNPNFSGVVLISINEEPVVQEVMGDSNITEHIPNQMNTRFAIASGCKIFTAIAILKLVEMGKLSLDDSVTDCLPNYFKSMNNSVTIRHLLTHTSGFCDYFDEETDEDGYAKVWEDTPMYMMKSPGDFLKLLQNKEMEFQPGYRFKYNNGGFVILSMIIENCVSYGYGVWLDTLNEIVMKIHIMGGDPGVSFRSAYYPNSKIVCTVLCNRDAGSLMAFKVAENMMSTM